MLGYGVLVLTVLFALLAVVRLGLAKRRAWSWSVVGLGLAGAALFVKAPVIGSALILGAVALATRAPKSSQGSRRARALKLLGLPPSASKDAIRAAYRDRMRDAHPDRGGSPDRAAALNAARDLLLKENSVGDGG